jgi:putative ABC transport system ATP-binding protein
MSGALNSARPAPAACTAVMGASGSGKTTLLHCAAGLDRPTSGQDILAGTREPARRPGSGTG